MNHDDGHGSSARSLEEFKQRVTIIGGDQADHLRATYVDRFVDTTSDYFRRLIADHGPQGDEVCYTGYLWDTLKRPEVITEVELLARLAAWNEVYAFWDLHNARKIHIPNYWKFPLKAVLRLQSADRIDALVHDSNVERYEDMFLPQDIYIFDKAMGSSLIPTHETTESGERWCLEAR